MFNNEKQLGTFYSYFIDVTDKLHHALLQRTFKCIMLSVRFDCFEGS